MSDLFDVAIVGAGLSALSALKEAGQALRQRTIVLDHREQVGGFLLPTLPAAEFAEEGKLIQSFRMPSTVTPCFQTTAVGLLPSIKPGQPHTLIIRQRQGTAQIQARTIIIASGALERPREQASIPGTRPAGVMTPILAHQLLSQGYLPGKHAIVYGTSRYAQATASRLASAGVNVTMLHPSRDTYGEQAEDVLEIQGFPRLEAVKIRQNGQVSTLHADTLLYTVGAMANTHWLKGSGIELHRNGSIHVDTRYHTNIAGIYAVGNVVTPSLDHTHSIKMGKEIAMILQGEQQ